MSIGAAKIGVSFLLSVVREVSAEGSIILVIVRNKPELSDQVRANQKLKVDELISLYFRNRSTFFCNRRKLFHVSQNDKHLVHKRKLVRANYQDSF